MKYLRQGILLTVIVLDFFIRVNYNIKKPVYGVYMYAIYKAVLI